VHGSEWTAREGTGGYSSTVPLTGLPPGHARRSKELPAGAIVSKKELNRKYAAIGILSCVMLGLLVVVAMTSERWFFGGAWQHTHAVVYMHTPARVTARGVDASVLVFLSSHARSP
jgi:hypothetical protein